MRRSFVIVVLVLTATGLGGGALADPATSSLDSLVIPAEQGVLLSELARIEPAERIRELADYGARQSDSGGGFYGMLPDQLVPAESLPIPADPHGLRSAALRLAQQRRINRAALEQLNPDYPQEFRGRPLSGFLESLPPVPAGNTAENVALDLELDLSAIGGFFAALADGEVSPDEADSLASLPSNRAMLEHRRNLGYIPEPLPDVGSLSDFIAMAGSTDPLDRLWCWVNSQNAFGYADLHQHRREYRTFLDQLERDGDELVEAALHQIEAFTPPNTQFQTTFAFTVGWAIRGWATPAMAGLNIEQVKDDWPFLFGTLVEETYHRLQLELVPTPTGRRARSFEDLVAIDTGDAGLDRLHEIVTYTVAEGSANLVRGSFAPPAIVEKAPRGADLLARFVRQVVEEGNGDAADALINEGLQANGPLYGLGWKLASLVADQGGDRAVGTWLRRGAVDFFLHAAEVAVERGEPVVTPEVVAAIRRLEESL